MWIHECHVPCEDRRDGRDHCRRLGGGETEPLDWCAHCGVAIHLHPGDVVDARGRSACDEDRGAFFLHFLVCAADNADVSRVTQTARSQMELLSQPSRMLRIDDLVILRDGMVHGTEILRFP